MELANQGMFFDDEEVNAREIRGGGGGLGGLGGMPGSLSTCRDRDVAPQVRKHKAANDKSDGLCVGLAKSELKPLLFYLSLPVASVRWQSPPHQVREDAGTSPAS